MADYLAGRAAVNKNLAKDKKYIIKTILFISQGQEDTDLKIAYTTNACSRGK